MGWLTKLTDRGVDLLARLPSTNARIATTILCMLSTCAVYLALAVVHVLRASLVGVEIKAGPLWEPSAIWLGFLLSMAGVDTAHFFAKRRTEFSGGTPPNRPSGAVPTPPPIGGPPA